MAARAKPITAVLVCSVTPTYGAISRSPTISSTSTAPELRKVTAPATHPGSAPAAGASASSRTASATSEERGLVGGLADRLLAGEQLGPVVGHVVDPGAHRAQLEGLDHLGRCGRRELRDVLVLRVEPRGPVVGW